MAIKNKDGSVYKLRSPNKLVQDQEFWENLVFHNFKWRPKVVSDSKPKIEDKIIFESSSLNEPEPEIVTQVEEPVTEPAESIEPRVKKPEIELKNVAIIHCLPALVKRHVDVLYDDSYTKIHYGEKFVFDAVVLSMEDLQFVFWTNKELTKKSVIYPSRYKSGGRFGDYRWWRIEKVEPKSNGFIVTTSISDYQPDFT